MSKIVKEWNEIRKDKFILWGKDTGYFHNIIDRAVEEIEVLEAKMENWKLRIKDVLREIEHEEGRERG